MSSCHTPLSPFFKLPAAHLCPFTPLHPAAADTCGKNRQKSSHPLHHRNLTFGWPGRDAGRQAGTEGHDSVVPAPARTLLLPALPPSTRSSSPSSRQSVIEFFTTDSSRRLCQPTRRPFNASFLQILTLFQLLSKPNRKAVSAVLKMWSYFTISHSTAYISFHLPSLPSSGQESQLLFTQPTLISSLLSTYIHRQPFSHSRPLPAP